MKTKALTAAQIDCLAQRLSDAPILRAATAKKAVDNLARLLATRIAAEGAQSGHESRNLRRRILNRLIENDPPPSSTAQAQCITLATSIPTEIRMDMSSRWLRTACPVSPASPYKAIKGIA